MITGVIKKQGRQDLDRHLGQRYFVQFRNNVTYVPILVNGKSRF